MTLCCFSWLIVYVSSGVLVGMFARWVWPVCSSHVCERLCATSIGIELHTVSVWASNSKNWRNASSKRKVDIVCFQCERCWKFAKTEKYLLFKTCYWCKNYLWYFAILPRVGLTSSPYKELTGTSELCKLEYLFVRPLCAGTVLLCCWCVCYACYVSV